MPNKRKKQSQNSCTIIHVKEKERKRLETTTGEDLQINEMRTTKVQDSSYI